MIWKGGLFVMRTPFRFSFKCEKARFLLAFKLIGLAKLTSGHSCLVSLRYTTC